MPVARFKIVEIVGWRDLHRAGPEFPIHEDRVPDDWYETPRQRELDVLADEPVVTRVLRMDGNAGVPQHGFRSRRRDGQVRGRIVRQRIADVVELAGGVRVLHLDVGKGRETPGAPVDETFPAVDEAVFIEPDEHLAHGLRQALIHREAQAVPVARRAEALELLDDRAAGPRFPLPDPLDEPVTPQLV